MKIIFVSSEIGPGGAERVISILTKGLANKGHSISLLTLDDGAKSPFYPIDSKVAHIPVWERNNDFNSASNVLVDKAYMILRLLQSYGDLTQKRWILKLLLYSVMPFAYFILLLRLRRVVNQHPSDVVISFIDVNNIAVLLSMIGRQTPVIVSERVDPFNHKLGWHLVLLRKLLYNRAYRLVVQYDAIKLYFGDAIRKKSIAISNPVLPPRVKSECNRENIIISVGRLDPQKGFDHLIRTIKIIENDLSGWKIVIIGEGVSRKGLESLVDNLGLSKIVSLPGNIADIVSWYKKAGIFVLSSRYEGMPNALCEAMANGCPVIATRCSAGVEKVVENGVDGLLVDVDSEKDLARDLLLLIKDNKLRLRLSQNAVKIADRFMPEKIIDEWESLVKDAVLNNLNGN